MTPDRESRNDPARLDEAVDRAVRAFEQHWHNDHDYRIEQFLPLVRTLNEPVGVDADDPVARHRIVSELIAVEMSLRSNDGQEVRAREYESRFWGYRDEIAEAIRWLDQQNRDDGVAPNLQDAIELVREAFECAWQADSSFRIEDILPRIPELIGPTRVDPHHPIVQQRIIAALFRVEMNLRVENGQDISPYEYLLRFPDAETDVEAACEWVRNQDVTRPAQPGREVIRVKPRSPDDLPIADDSTITGVLEIQLDPDADGSYVPEQLGPYRIISFLAEGSFGIVYRAHDNENDRDVALKFPRKRPRSNNRHLQSETGQNRTLQMLHDEAQQAMVLNHEGIVATWAVEVIDGYFFIVQQLIEGTDLKKTIRDPRTRQEIATLIARIADALAYAHLKEIIHRDLKPANILLDQNGNPYIADFGLALNETAQLRASNTICGTIPYMPPEQAAGSVQLLGCGSDIWSLGVILYELLTGGQRRPFRGVDNHQILEQIETREPKALRAIDPSIDRELQRICLKCLSKPISRRYLTADDLALDLRQFASGTPEPKLPDVKFIPNGLPAYDRTAADFFLQLLPGPRDQNGIPESIRFWKTRICEPVPPENRVPVGVLYGPSGSGKSSFVKAGLIPQVQSHVETIYVECTQQESETEVRLMRALRDHPGFHEIPSTLSLPETLSGLAAGRWQRSPRKVLIVLDQFEQRLSVGERFGESQLVAAMRECDGQTIQFLLSVRDDFWMVMTRFADALAMDLQERRNTLAIDLFDQDHAKKILVKIGHAYGRLPSDQIAGISTAQSAFIGKAIEQLAEGQRVICVRLTLFAEMFRDREWTVSELNRAGDVTGVGKLFLESRLGPHNKKVPHEPALELLAALLPASGLDIRGSMKSRFGLMVAAKLESDPDRFDRLMKYLEHDLRLITRTDPDVSGQVGDDSQSGRENKYYYQLTHDYLVPSVRAWLDDLLGDSRKGRATLRLRRLASQVIPGKTPENLPTHFEWLSWAWLLRNEDLAGTERTIIRSGGRRFLKDFSLVSVAVLTIGALVSFWVVTDRNNRNANSLVDAVMSLNYSDLPKKIAELPDYESRVIPQFEDLGDTNDDDQKRRALLGLLQFKPEHATEIAAHITRPDCGPEELAASLAILQQYAAGDPSRFLTTFGNETADSRSRFRSAVALSLLGQHDDELWSDRARLVGTALILEPLTTHSQWIELLAPVGKFLVPEFQALLEVANEATATNPLAQAIYEFLDPDKRDAWLAALVTRSNDAQFNSVLSIYEANNTRDRLKPSLSQLDLEPDDERGNASRALALLRLGDDTDFVRRLSDIDRAGTRSHTIVLANPIRVNFQTLKSVYERESRQDDFVRMGLLMIFAERAQSFYDDRQPEWIAELVEERCVEDLHAGCFAAAELLGRRVDGLDLDGFRESRGKNRRKGSVFINSQGMAFSVIRPSAENGLQETIAVAMTELAEKDFAKCPTYATESPNSSNRPLNVRDAAIFDRYCEWLSSEDRRLGNGPAGLANADSGSDYHLLTRAEWLVVRDAPDDFPGFLGHDLSLVKHFAWLSYGGFDQLHDAGTLLPNRFGIFDLYGNANEICRTFNNGRARYTGFGQTVRSTTSDITGRSAWTQKQSIRDGEFEIGDDEIRDSNFYVGFRLVRVLGEIAE